MANILERADLHALDWSDVSDGENIGAVPPGDVLRLEFLQPMRKSARALARELGVPPNLVTGILNGERAITARTALLLGRQLGTSAEFWMNLQTAHDLEKARIDLGMAA